jgi:anti-sigma B factor antagonist
MNPVVPSCSAEQAHRVCVEEEMTIYTAARHKVLLLDAVRGSGTRPLEIDLSGVTEIDSAGVQVMLAARRSAAGSGRALRFIAGDSAVRSTLALLGLDSLVNVNGASAAGETASAISGSREEGA